MQQREEEGRHAKDLKQQIGHLRAGISDQVHAAATSDAVFHDGSCGVVRHQAEQNENAEGEKHEAGDFVKPFVGVGDRSFIPLAGRKKARASTIMPKINR